jgi:hypothetical protein
MKFINKPISQTDTHGVRKMILDLPQVLQITVNQRFKLSLFLEKKFEHEGREQKRSASP